MKPESGPSPYHPSTWEILRYAYLPEANLPKAKEALKGWMPRVNRTTLLRAIGLAPLPLAGTSLLPSLALAQEQPPAFYQQTAANLDLNSTDVAGVTADADSGASDASPPPIPEVAPNPARLRVYNNLQVLLQNPICQDGKWCVNTVITIDPNEVEAFGNSPDQNTFNSFRVSPNATGDSDLILITGGPGGLNPEAGNIQSVEAAIARLNQIDPDMMDVLTTQYGLRIFGGSTSLQIFVNNPNYASSFDTIIKSISLNENLSNPYRSPSFLIWILITEARGIAQYSGIDIPDQYDDNLGIDKNLFFINWLNTHRKAFSDSEYKSMLGYANSGIEFYKQNPTIGMRPS